MQIEKQASREVITRLRRVEGQIGGIIRMLDEGRDCADVVTQLAAANRALSRAGFSLLATGMKQCLSPDPDSGTEPMPIETLEKLFLSLA